VPSTLNDQSKEKDARSRYITPAIEKAGWPKDQMRTEHHLTDGRILIDVTGPFRSTERKICDYLLIGKGGKELAVVEAKKSKFSVSHGIQQAMEYAKLMGVPFAYSSNGYGFYEHDFLTGIERELSIDEFPTEEELWNRYVTAKCIEPNSSLLIPFYHEVNGKNLRYYQRLAVDSVLEAVEEGKKRILLVMATGTGKTYVSMQIIHKLLESKKAHRVLFLVDRNYLVDQSMINDFKQFSKIMTKVQSRTMNSAYVLHLALYQQLVGEEGKNDPFTQFSSDYFDFIIVDECHRGSARENSKWRKILDYFHNAAHIGMTATPKENEDISTSQYFGEAVYSYSYRQGVEDGFLAPFRLRSFGTTIDHDWHPSDDVRDENGCTLDGPYNRPDYDRQIVVDSRTKLVAEVIVNHLNDTDPFAKTIVFCVDINHADRMRQAIAELVPERMREDSRYTMKITGDDQDGKAQLDNFTDKNSKYPVIVTTSELLTTGVDCFMTKAIAIDRPIGSITEFKQILGRGSRLDPDKDKWYFTILDFRGVAANFIDDWDGDPEPFEPIDGPMKKGEDIPKEPPGKGGWKKIRIKGKIPIEIEVEIDRTYGPGGQLTTENIIDFSKKKMLGECPTLTDFLKKWNSDDRKKVVISELEARGVLVQELRSHVNRPELDDFDMLCYLVYGRDPITKTERADLAKNNPMLDQYNVVAHQVLDAIIDKYRDSNESDMTDITILKLKEFEKFGSISNIIEAFGGKNEYLKAVKEVQNLIYS
jgi:type I restriction enzyme R subunit